MKTHTRANWFAVVLAPALLALVLAVAPTNVSAQEEDGWWTEGTGTYFEITDSDYLNVTLASSEVVYVYLESVPGIVSFHIESDSPECWTTITLDGFEPNKLYYRYQDGDLVDEFMIDAYGTYAFPQDISTGHHVFLQEDSSTVYIRPDGTIDPSTAPIKRDGDMYTLTANIYESVFIQKSDITLDGGGFTLESPGRKFALKYGLYLSGVSGVTIRDLIVANVGNGAHLSHCSSNTITDSTFLDNSWSGIFLSRSSGDIIAGNAFRDNGCGITCESSSPTVTNNTITGSSSGGIYCRYSSATVTNNSISDNTAGYAGGGISCYRSSPTVAYNIINDNTAGYYGGGIYCRESQATLTNNMVTDNSARSGGGIHFEGRSSPGVTFNTITANSADRGGGIYCGTYSSPTVTNCIVWGNSDPQIELYWASPVVTYCDVQDGWTGEGNIDADPLFVAAWEGDFHLQPESPCIDRGTDRVELPRFDFEGDPRVVDGDGDSVAVADMGADEYVPAPVIEVAIDIKPGSYPNSINLGSHGVIPVAILSSADFDAATIDADTVALEGAGGVAVRGKGSKLMAHYEDVNEDGRTDLVLQVETENLDPGQFQDGFALITGKTYGGEDFWGQDEITIVPPP